MDDLTPDLAAGSPRRRLFSLAAAAVGAGAAATVLGADPAQAATAPPVRTMSNSQWLASTYVLAAGEAGYASDLRVLKVGDGKTKWQYLPSFVTKPTIEALIDQRIKASTQTQPMAVAVSGPRIPVSPAAGALGHSIIAAGDDTGGDFNTTIQNLVSAHSGGRFDLQVNAGFPGMTSAYIRQQIPTYIKGKGLGLCLVMARTNDPSGGKLGSSAALTLDQSKAAHAGIIDDLLSLGIVPIMMTTLPVNSASADIKLENARFDNWLKDYCAHRSIPCVDTWALCVAETANAWPSDDWTYSGTNDSADGIHPSPMARQVIAREVLKVIPDFWPTRVREARTQADPNTLLPGGLFLTESGGIGGNWADAGSNAGSRRFTIVDNPAGPGRMQQISLDESVTAAAGIGQRIDLTGHVTEGDLIALFAVVDVEDTAKAKARNVNAAITVSEGGSGLTTVRYQASLAVGCHAQSAVGISAMSRRSSRLGSGPARGPRSRTSA